jgi:hypothetical protein
MQYTSFAKVLPSFTEESPSLPRNYRVLPSIFSSCTLWNIYYQEWIYLLAVILTAFAFSISRKLFEEFIIISLFIYRNFII